MKNSIVLTPIIPNVIIVDDIPANLKILSDILEGEGYTARPVLNGKLALQIAEKEKPDLILLDIMMPDMDGYEVCREFKERRSLKDIPIIFISALNDTNDIVKALKSGGVDYISKPFRAEEVLARVNTHLEISQQKKELQAINAEKDRFFSIIAHDLRSPFNSFLGLTRMMVDDIHSLDLQEIHEIAVILRNSASNVYGLLENLLEWASIKRGLAGFNPRSLLLLNLLENSLQATQEFATSKGIKIEFDVPNDLKLCADANMLASIFRNLISNALKFTNPGGVITVSAKDHSNGNVLIGIQDTGIGMSNEMVDHLFRQDRQTGRKGTDGEASSGLGLIICKDFVEQHEGKLWVESEEGKGSVFYLLIGKEIKN
jgi:signal transduction histidine kinase